MRDVGCFAEWEVEVELDPQALARAVAWMVGRLVDECRAEDVPPVGVLTITDAAGANLGDFRTVRRSVNLQIDPAAVWDWTPPAPEPPRRSSWWARLRRRVLANPD